MAYSNRAVQVSVGGLMAMTLGMVAGRAGSGLDRADPGLEQLVAVVDYEKIVRSVPSAKERIEDLNKQAQALATEMDALKAQLTETEEQLSKLNRRAHDYYSLSEKRMNLRGMLEHKAKVGEEWLRLERNKHREAITSEIDAKVAEIAKKTGIRLVLRYRVLDEKLRTEERQRLRAGMSVVYHDESLDLTDKIIKLMMK